jgi:O-antigen/teichoic acid export membrane protein
MIAALPTFWKHLLTVLGGSLAAQALPIAAAPFITRLCTPAELGAFSVWFGVVAIAAVAATLRLENAMVVDHARIRQRLGFDVVAWSAGWLAVSITAALAAARLLGFTHMPWTGVLTLGVAAWLTATMQTTLAYAASHNAFAPAARARIVAAGGVAGSQLALLALLAWLLPQHAGAGALALLAGQLLGLGVGLYAARRLLRLPLRAVPGTRDPASRTGPPISGRRASALLLVRLARRLLRRGPQALLPNAAQRRYLHRHRALWHFTLPSNLLNAAVGQLPLLLIGARHGAMAAGLFALTQRVLAAPISLLAASVLEVFKRESVRQYQELGNCRRAYVHALRVLLALGIAPALLLWVAAPGLFALAFGADWRGAGQLAQVLAPLFFLNFVASPLSYVFFVAGRQKIELLWQVALCVVTVAAFAAPLTLAHNVLAYTIGYSLLYLVYLQLSYRYALNRTPGRRLHVVG